MSAARVIVFAAHPDDDVLGMGGTIGLHATHGDEVRVVCVTDGSSTQYPGDAERREQKEREAKYLQALAETIERKATDGPIPPSAEEVAGLREGGAIG